MVILWTLTIYRNFSSFLNKSVTEAGYSAVFNSSLSRFFAICVAFQKMIVLREMPVIRPLHVHAETVPDGYYHDAWYG